MNDIEVTVYDVNYLPDYVEAEEERQANEAIRIANENTRIANEATRVSNESTRTSAESGRATAEQGRVSAEAIRVSNENARIAAEEEREELIDSLATVATTGKYSDLIDEPTKVSDFTNDSGFINRSVNDLTYYTLATDTGSTIDLSINSSTYVVTLALKNAAGTTISSGTIDLPLETVVVSGSYDSTNKKVVLTLQNGSTIEFSVADLVAGLQSEITSNNKLSSDLVDDTNHSHKFVTASQKTIIDSVKTDYAHTLTLSQNLTTGDLTVGISNYNGTTLDYGTVEGIATRTYVDDLVGDIDTILTTLDVGNGVD